MSFHVTEKCDTVCPKSKNLKCAEDLRKSPEKNAYVCECKDSTYEFTDPGVPSAGCQIIDLCRGIFCLTEGQCKNFSGSVRCSCNSGFFGPSCQLRCTLCQNGGTCLLDGNNNVKCTCPHSYTGDMCECKVDVCANHNCGSDDKCVEKCNSFTCLCDNDTQFWNGSNCQDIDICALGLLKCGQWEDCVINECKCKDGHAKDGDKCSSTFDICKTNNITCPPNSECESTVESYECRCKDGFYQTNRNEKQLKVECKPLTCEDKCPYPICHSRGYCLCPDGSEMDAQKECKHAIGCDAVRTEECEKLNKICLKTNVCECKKGYKLKSGDEKCEDINECSIKYFQEYCKPYGECENSNGSFICSCKNNIYDKDNNKCLPVNECEKKTHNCNGYSTDCIDTDQGFTCRCKKGFLEENSTFCKFDDVCARETPCGSAKCVNNVYEPKKYVCVCGSAENYDETAKTCVPVKRLYPSKLKLKDVFDKKLEDPNSEEFYEKKRDFENTMSLALTEAGNPATIKVSSFRNGSIDVSFTVLTNAVITPEIVKKALKDQCTEIKNTDIDNVCAVKGKLLLDLDFKPEFQTACPELITRDDGECPEKEGTCILDSQGKPFDCICHKGYTKIGSDKCVDIDECTSTTFKHDCKKSDNKICLNIPGSYKCECDSGYIESQSKCLKMCDDYNPCENNGKCLSKADNSWECQCKVGFTGNTCQYKQDDARASSQIAVFKAAVGVLGSLLLITIVILTFLLIRRRKALNSILPEHDQEIQDLPNENSWFHYLTTNKPCTAPSKVNRLSRSR